MRVRMIKKMVFLERRVIGLPGHLITNGAVGADVADNLVSIYGYVRKAHR